MRDGDVRAAGRCQNPKEQHLSAPQRYGNRYGASVSSSDVKLSSSLSNINPSVSTT
jgi:hypothetical protein